MPVPGAEAQQPRAITKTDHTLLAHEPGVSGEWIELVVPWPDQHPPAHAEIPLHLRIRYHLARGLHPMLGTHLTLLPSSLYARRLCRLDLDCASDGAAGFILPGNAYSRSLVNTHLHPRSIRQFHFHCREITVTGHFNDRRTDGGIEP